MSMLTKHYGLWFKLFVFESLYNDVLNDHAPLKQFHMKGNQIPYMTEQWRINIRYRNKLWKQFKKDGTDTNCKETSAHRLDAKPFETFS